MARVKIIDESAKTDYLWVKIPVLLNGRSIQTMLASLAGQIKAKHYDLEVKRFYLDKDTRELRIEFENED